ncbi:chitinase domain-containing protein 1 precursor, partial [Thraustotheca clavata]
NAGLHGDTCVKSFQGDVLGYVTPWNGRGYEAAKLFRRKFSMIAPVWYQIRRNEDEDAILTGAHDVDQNWMQEVKGNDGLGPKIVPRIVFEMNWLNGNDVKKIVQLVKEEVKTREFDGIVLEIPVVEITVDLIQKLGKAMKKMNCILVFVLPTSQRDVMMELFAIDCNCTRWQSYLGFILYRVMPNVDRFSVNAYDYSSSGPNAPLPWLEATLSQLTPPSKFMMGLAFYGYDTNEAVIGNKYLELLKEYKPEIQWDSQAHECFFEYGNKRKVYYPCLPSIQERLDLYAKNGFGAVIWEIGQGLDYFFDLL